MIIGNPSSLTFYDWSRVKSVSAVCAAIKHSHNLRIRVKTESGRYTLVESALPTSPRVKLMEEVVHAVGRHVPDDLLKEDAYLL